jgi:mono/diheme cytochrome c family protein
MKRTTSASSITDSGATTRLAVLVLLATGLTLPGCVSRPESGSGAPPGTVVGVPGRDAAMMGGYGMMGGPGMMGGYGMAGGRGPVGQPDAQRRRQATTAEVPAPYRGVKDPLPNTAAIVAAGKNLYAANCSACHGALGEGDGPAGSGLSPAPANLRALAHSPMGRDDYLMWAIGAGGAAYGTGMPAFKDSLPEDARWKIIRYLETL